MCYGFIRLLVLFIHMVLMCSPTTYGSTITGEPESLVVVGTLGNAAESLLTYPPSLDSLLSARRIQFYAPMVPYLSDSPGPKPALQTQPSSNSYLPPQVKESQDEKPRSSVSLSDLFTFDTAEQESALDKIQTYHKPVSIPSSGQAHFSTINVADGSYHFGYDTGSGQHQSYREERRFPGGRVEGRYGYVDPAGVLRIVEYTADQRGYRSKVTTRNPSFNPSIIGPIPPPLIPKARKSAAAAAAAAAAASSR